MSTQHSFQLKGGLFTLTVLHIHTADLKVFEEELIEKIDASPDFFKQIPVVVDLAGLPKDHTLELSWLRNLLLSKALIPVALRNVPKALVAKAVATEWAIFPDGKNKSAKGQEAKAQAAVEKVQQPVASNNDLAEEGAFEQNALDKEGACVVHLVTQQVRSGQQIFRPSGDVVIVNTVNTGAEVLADGNIHIYGALRGRALAGINGNTKARIFCQSLEAELISIAGKYKVIEELSDQWKGKAVQIYLDQDELKIEQFIK